ncbi:MAG: lipoprotein [Bacteroidota bacterium]
MKKLIFFSLIVVLLASCSFETYQCHSYGNTNHITKHGHKAQGKYTKRRI